MAVDKKRGYASVGVGGILETSASSLEFLAEMPVVNDINKRKTNRSLLTYIPPIYLGDIQGKMSNSKKWLRTPAYTKYSTKNSTFVERSYRIKENNFRLSRTENWEGESMRGN